MFHYGYSVRRPISAMLVEKSQAKYRVVKQNLQLVRFRDFEHMRASIAQIFFKASRHDTYLLIQSKKLS